MYDDEYPEDLVCRCSHTAEHHLWILKEEDGTVKAEPLNIDAENFANGYAIGKCWSELDLEGRHCLCEILNFEFAGDWSELAGRMSTKIENSVKYRIKRIGVEP